MDKDDENYKNKMIKDHCHYTEKFRGAAQIIKFQRYSNNNS